MKKQVSRIISMLLSVVMVSSSFAFAENTVQQSKINYEGFMAGKTQQMNIYYDDSYWVGSSTKHNEHLASLSMALALTGYDKKTENAVKALETIGCSNVKSKEYKSTTENVAAAVMGSKKLLDGTTLVPVVVKGTKTDMIWAKNIQLGLNGEATGFKTAANRTYNYITSYVNGLKVKNVKVWIMGHSRYGAIANLTAKRLNSKYGKKNVYAYCFENPMTAIKNSKNSKATNIHNIRDLDSGITKMAPEYMNFGVYGKWDKSFSVKNGNEAKMKEMLAKINTSANAYKSPNEFCWSKTAKLSLNDMDKINGLVEQIKTGGMESLGLLSEKWEAGSQEELWSLLMKRLKTMAKSRKAYSVTKSSRSIAAAKELGYKKSDVYTIEEALQEIIRVMNSLSPSETEEVQNQVIGSLGTTMPEFISNPLGGILVNVFIVGKVDAKDILGKKDSDYAKYVKKFWKSTKLEKSKALTKLEKKKLKLSISTMLYPLLKVIEKDMGNDRNREVLITALNNIDSLIQAHYPEVTMAWMMTEDSNYTGE